MYDGITEIESSRIPDYRQQLLWMPEFNFYGNEQEITFYTSDNKGVYEISFEGFTSQGKPVSIKEIITVE